MALSKQARTTARTLFKLSLDQGQLSEAKVRDVLAWFDQKRPRQAAAILREYQRLVAGELRRSRAIVEHSGTLPAGQVAAIAAELTRIYRRPIAAETRENPTLLAGLRVSIGDDVFERSLAGQLQTLADATA